MPPGRRKKEIKVQYIALLLSLFWLQGTDQTALPKANKAVRSAKAIPASRGKASASEQVPLGDAPKFVHDLYGVPYDSGGKTIAIVVPFHYPDGYAGQDLDTFSKQFQLPLCNEGTGCLEVLRSTDTPNCEWAREAALNLQWTHAMAPKAHLLLVEAKTDSPDDLFPAVKRAAKAVIKAGGGEVVLPWTYCSDDDVCERPDDRKKYDGFFIKGVVYFAAAGDADIAGTAAYPSTSPRVVSVGGTLPNDAQTVEKGWAHSRGGGSKYERKPSYQKHVENMPQKVRYTPDIAVTARSVAVYLTSSCPEISSGWQAYQGATSSSTPIAAGMANAAGHFNRSSKKELRNIYGNRCDTSRVKDIIIGNSGVNAASSGYDPLTGVGAPLGTDFDAPPSNDQCKDRSRHKKKSQP
jgi:kumamolisin